MYSNQMSTPVKLKRLPKNGTIGIFGPSSPAEQERLERGIKYIESLGYRVKTTKSCYSGIDYLAGTGKERADDLHQLIEDKTVDAVFCLRGGFGAIMMLPYLDYDKICQSKKMIVGFSDVTALQWAFIKKRNYPSISAGMIATDMAKIPIEPEFEASFWQMIEHGTIDYSFDFKAKEEKEIKGWALPGTMSVAAMLFGSEYFPSTKGAIMILEDVDEPRHKIEAYLNQFKLSGAFSDLNALVLGAFSPAPKEQYPEVPSLQTVFDRTLNELNVAVAQNLSYGHVPGKISLPVGTSLSLSLGATCRIQSLDSIFER